MIKVGEYLVRTDGKTFRVARIDCPEHGPISECRVLVDCGNDHIATVDFACQHCPEGAVVVAVPTPRPVGELEIDPERPKFPTMSIGDMVERLAAGGGPYKHSFRMNPMMLPWSAAQLRVWSVYLEESPAARSAAKAVLEKLASFEVPPTPSVSEGACSRYDGDPAFDSCRRCGRTRSEHPVPEGTE